MMTTNSYREALDRANARKLQLHQLLVHNVRALMLKGLLEGRTSFACCCDDDCISIDGVAVVGSEDVGADVFAQVLSAVPHALHEVLGSALLTSFDGETFVISTVAHERKCRELNIRTIFDDGTVFLDDGGDDPDAPTVIADDVVEQLTPEHATECFSMNDEDKSVQSLGDLAANLRGRPSRISFARQAQELTVPSRMADAESAIKPDGGAIQLKFKVDGLVYRTQILVDAGQKAALREALLRGQQVSVEVV